MKEPKGTSDGEEAVANTLRRMNIKYKREYKIEGLKSDTKKFRVADFYLPEYDIFVEYEGEWYHPREKQRYKEKQRVYTLNNIKCIYIYPNDLRRTTKLIQKGISNQEKKIIESQEEQKKSLSERWENRKADANDGDYALIRLLIGNASTDILIIIAKFSIYIILALSLISFIINLISRGKYVYLFNYLIYPAYSLGLSIALIIVLGILGWFYNKFGNVIIKTIEIFRKK